MRAISASSMTSGRRWRWAPRSRANTWAPARSKLRSTHTPMQPVAPVTRKRSLFIGFPPYAAVFFVDAPHLRKMQWQNGLFCDPAAVHQPIGAGDERGSLAGQEIDRLGNLGGIGPALESLLGLALLFDLLERQPGAAR